MVGAGPEQNRHKKRDHRAEADPPGKFHQGQPVRLGVKFCAEDSGDAVWQSAQDRDNDEADDHRHDVANIVTAAFAEHSAQEYAEKRAVGVAENSEDYWDDAHFRMDNHDV